MLRFLTDEDFHGPIIDGIRLHHPDLDLLRAVDVGLAGMDDDPILEWAAAHHRIVVSHDVNTMTDAAKRRVAMKLPMIGLIIVPQSLPYRIAIEHLYIVASLAIDAEFQDATIYLPL